MPKKRPRRYDAAFQRHAAEQVLLHHRPIAQVARQQHCSPQSVKNWIDRYRSSSGDASMVLPPAPSSSKTSISRTTFLPLQIDDGLPLPSIVASKIEVVTKNGLTLRFPVDTPSDTLIGIVRQLEGVSC